MEQEILHSVCSGADAVPLCCEGEAANLLVKLCFCSRLWSQAVVSDLKNYIVEISFFQRMFGLILKDLQRMRRLSDLGKAERRAAPPLHQTH